MIRDASALGLAEAAFRTVFDVAGDAIVLVNIDTRTVRDANPAACRLMGYTRAEMIGMRIADLIHPDSRALYASIAGQEVQRLPIVARRKDGSPIDVEATARDVVHSGLPTRCIVAREITDQARAFELLEGRVAQRTRELTALLQISQAVNGTLELQPLLGLLLDLLARVVEYTEASINCVDGDELTVADYRGPHPRDVTLALRYPIDRAPMFQAVLRRGGPVILNDVEGDSELARAFQSNEFRSIDPRPMAVRSMLGVPLVVKDRIIGQLRLNHALPGFYTQAHADIALAIANQASIAMENARLFERERTTRERLDVALAAGRMGTWEWDAMTNTVRWSTQLEAIHGLQPGTFGGTFEAYLSDIYPDDIERVQRSIAESLATGDYHLEYRIIWPDGSLHWLGTSGRVVRDRDGNTVGMRGVCHDITSRKMQEDERARLQERERIASEARAALEERQRLARELHDSVSQALYGIALGSQTALAALEEDRNTEAAADAARYVHKLAEASIAEMRALILELRPESVEQEGLVAALERHVASVRGRHALQVEATLDREPEISLELKQTLYRIAQESMHNVIKHARATTLRLSLRHVDGHVTMEVADDGVGFDPTAAYPGHLGLVSMHERAAAAGGTLRIESAPRSGTRVIVDVPAA